MLHKDRDERDGYVYDASVKGGDTTFWAHVVGSIATDTTEINKTVRVTSARLHSFLQHIYGKYEFGLLQPTAPGAGTNNSFGLRAPKDDTTGSDTGLVGGGIYFEMDTNSVFRAVSYDDFGNRQATVIDWDTDWDGKQAKYTINWEADIVNFLVNDTIVATHSTRVPTKPLPLELRNGAATNIDMAYVRVARAGAIV